MLKNLTKEQKENFLKIVIYFAIWTIILIVAASTINLTYGEKMIPWVILVVGICGSFLVYTMTHVRAVLTLGVILSVLSAIYGKILFMLLW